MTLSTIRPNRGFTRQTIFDNGRTIIRHLRNNARRSDRLVITFAEMMMNDPARPGFAQDFLIKNGFDVVTVQKTSESWYQDLSLDHFRRAVLRVSGTYSGICCYGISMGAFAALYFGGSVDASIIAISPLCSIHPLYPALGAREHRKAVLATQVDLADTARGSGPVLVIYDPLARSDRLYIREEVRPAFLQANYVAAPGTGHPSSASLKEMGILQPMVLSFIETGTPADLRLRIRAARRQSPSYMLRMAELSLRYRRPTLGQQFVKCAERIAPQNEQIRTRCAKVIQQIDTSAVKKTAII